MRWRLKPGSLLGGGFLVLALFVMMSVLFVVRQQNDDALLRHTLEIEVHLNDVLSALQDGESGQRGFLLTGDPAFLAPYDDAVSEIPSKLEALRNAVTGSATLEAHYDRLRSLAHAKQAELDRTLALYRQGDGQGALALVRRRSGKETMDAIRTEIASMDGEADRLVAEQQWHLRHVGMLIAATTAISLALMGGVALAALRVGRRHAMLTRFLPAELAPRLAAGDKALLRGINGPATIVFVDLRGSTGLAETLPPDRVSAILSCLRREISGAAKAHSGLVDKFMGDGALVVFGLLQRQCEASADALRFAEDLLDRLAVSGTGLEVGIGINHGDVFCGVIGDAERMEFTVLGDTVNVASRLEQLTRQHQVRLLVSEAVLCHAGRDLADWSLVGAERLPGRCAAVVLYAEPGRFATCAG